MQPCYCILDKAVFRECGFSWLTSVVIFFGQKSNLVDTLWVVPHNNISNVTWKTQQLQNTAVLRKRERKICGIMTSYNRKEEVQGNRLKIVWISALINILSTSGNWSESLIFQVQSTKIARCGQASPDVMALSVKRCEFKISWLELQSNNIHLFKPWKHMNRDVKVKNLYWKNFEKVEKVGKKNKARIIPRANADF